MQKATITGLDIHLYIFIYLYIYIVRYKKPKTGSPSANETQKWTNDLCYRGSDGLYVTRNIGLLCTHQ